MSQYLSHLILGASLLVTSPMSLAQFVPLTDLPSVPKHTIPVNIPATDTSVKATLTESEARQLRGFAVPTEKGSETIAHFMKKLEPRVDTSIPESRNQAALRINHLINTGKYQVVLSEINKLKRPDGNIATPSTDVQLLFLEARTYAAMGDRNEALDIYRKMAYRYPELAEPWNNMAVLQFEAGLAEQALESIKMALAIRPNYAIANQNIGLIYTQLAKQSFNQAR